MTQKIQNIALVGGTHGNEKTGIFLLQQWRQQNLVQRWREFDIHLLLANPKACELNRRFVDEDLNRCFKNSDLLDLQRSSYEASRASALTAFFGSKKQPKMDFIIDLHTTTANMGVSLIITNENPFIFKLASFIQSRMDQCYIYYVPSKTYCADTDHTFMISMAENGLIIEVGPIANGIVRDDILKRTNQAVEYTLQFLQSHNRAEAVEVPATVTLYQHKKLVHFPTDERGRMDAIIHEQLQDRDYQLLQPGDPVFVTSAGEIIVYTEKQAMYPVFINEAAYYYQNIAFSLTQKTFYHNASS